MHGTATDAHGQVMPPVGNVGEADRGGNGHSKEHCSRRAETQSVRFVPFVPNLVIGWLAVGVSDLKTGLARIEATQAAQSAMLDRLDAGIAENRALLLKLLEGRGGD